MFKKSILALTVAGASIGAANAADIVTNVTEFANGAAVVTTPAADGCLAITGAGVADTGGNIGGDTYANVNGIYERVASAGAATDGNDTCTAKETLVTTPVASSIEKAASGTVALTAKIVAGIGGYEDESTITVNITGAPIDLATTVAPTLTWKDGANPLETIGVLDITNNRVRFTVPSLKDVPAGAIITINNVFLDATGLTEDTDIQVSSFATNSSAVDYDAADAATVLTLAPQYAASTTKAYNGIIDVAADRQSLTVGNDVLDEDKLTVKLTHTTVAAGAPGNIVPATVEHVIAGNFAWLAAADLTANGGDADGKVEAAEVLAYLNANATANAGGDATFFTTAGDDALASVSVNEDLDELTAVVTVNGGGITAVDAAHNFTLAVEGQAAGNPVLVATDYSATVTVKDATAAPNTISMSAGTIDAGEWTLNGSVVTIPYMPFDDNTAVIMRHTNTGVQEGAISVRYMLEGISTNWEDAGVVGSSSRGVQNIRDLVINAIKDASGVEGGKVAIEITTNVPKDDVTVYAGFRVKDENDRGFIGTFGKRGSTAAN